MYQICASSDQICVAILDHLVMRDSLPLLYDNVKKKTMKTAIGLQGLSKSIYVEHVDSQPISTRRNLNIKKGVFIYAKSLLW